MKRSLIIGGGIALFAGSAALAAFVADSTQEEPRAVLPAPAADAVGVQVGAVTPLLSAGAGEAQPLTPDDFGASAGGGAPGAEYVPLAGASAADSEGGGDETGDLEGEAAFAPDRGEYSLRFHDLCADNPASTGCPIGIGGTILPLGGGMYPEFEILSLNGGPNFWECSGSIAVEGEYVIMYTASHPARIEVSYWDTDRPAEVRTAVVDESDPEGDRVRSFIEYFESPAATDYPQYHCMRIEIDPGVTAYTLEAHATSFTGEVDDLTQVIDIPLQRPPVILVPRTDYQLRVGVPVSSEPRLTSQVRLHELWTTPEVPCYDRTAESLSADELVTPPASGRFERRDDTYGERSIRSPFDPSYDSLDLWTFDLQSSGNYVMCIWWLQSPEGSVDPADAEIVEVESRLIQTPDMLRTTISAFFMFAASDGPNIDAGSYRVTVEGPCESPGEVAVPPIPVEAGTATWDGDEVVLCQHNGLEGPASTRMHVRRPDGVVKTFSVPTPNTAIDYHEGLSYYLGDDAFCEDPGTFLSDSHRCFGPRIHVKVSHQRWMIESREWEFARPTSFHPTDLFGAGDPAALRLDFDRSSVRTIDRDSLEVTAVFAGPVTLTASLEGDPCVLGAVPSYTSSAPSETHTFVLDGLCTATDYGVRLQVAFTDDDGTTTTIWYQPDRWHGYGTTDGHHVSFTVAVSERRPGGSTEPLQASWTMRLDDMTVPLGAPSGCLEPTTTAPMEAVWGNTVEVYLSVRLLSAELVGGGRCSPTFAPGSTDLSDVLTGNITIELLRSGPVRMTVPFPGGNEVDIVITATFEE
jgi:hypothetical protein